VASNPLQGAGASLTPLKKYAPHEEGKIRIRRVGLVGEASGWRVKLLPGKGEKEGLSLSVISQRRACFSETGKGSRKDDAG